MCQKVEIEKILSILHGWKVVEGRNAIYKKFVFDDFKTCFDTMTKIALKAEEMNHHPEWLNVYNHLEITLTSHEKNEVTSSDFKLAQFIDSVIS
ncbi:MAG: 4a-hydroxytetrahydrobiopterin dehydratase [Emcibacteraceae bacterium]|jgi:4a-hydroxytetrahydrobiopterin dehydratase|tara:strand:- start:8967 stop:9248 length:282 start_codon:yes stop_codon:yes gene_type:complete